MTFNIFSMGRIGLTCVTDVFVECLGSRHGWITWIVTFKSALTAGAYPVTWEWLASTVDGWDRIVRRTWRIHKVGIFFGKQGGKNVVDIVRDFDTLVVANKVSANFPMINCAAAFNTDQSTVDGIDDETMFVEYWVGVCV